MRGLSIDFEALFESMPTPFMILDSELCFVGMNAAYLAVVARTRDDLIGKFVFDAFPESGERQEIMRQTFARALAGEETTVARNVFAIDRPGLGRQEYFWDVHHTPVRNAAGDVVGLLQFAQDVSGEVAAERMRDVISEEYDHRVRNLITKVSIIARHTARHSANIDSFIGDFDPRISALARTHELLVDGGWEALGLRALIVGGLQPFGQHGQTHVDGPDCLLSSRVAQALGMAIHELATNAAKYGALSREDGRLDVVWRVADDGSVTIDWRESGVTLADTNPTAGFGTTIIDRILPQETRGTVTRSLTASGLTCTITLPDPDQR